MGLDTHVPDPLIHPPSDLYGPGRVEVTPRMETGNVCHKAEGPRVTVDHRREEGRKPEVKVQQRGLSKILVKVFFDPPPESRLECRGNTVAS